MKHAIYYVKIYAITKSIFWSIVLTLIMRFIVIMLYFRISTGFMQMVTNDTHPHLNISYVRLILCLDWL